MLTPKAIKRHGLLYRGPERRRDRRFVMNCPVRIARIDGHTKSLTKKHFQLARIQNISQGGARILTLNSLDPGSLIVADMGGRRISDDIDWKQVLHLAEEWVLAYVMWRSLNLEKNLFEAGLRFVPAHQRNHFTAYLTLPSD